MVIDGHGITLNAGHNFVTVPGGAINLTARRSCRQIDEQGGAALEIFHWLNSIGNWEGYRCSTTAGDFPMSPGHAPMDRVGQPTTWRPHPPRHAPPLGGACRPQQ